MQKTPIGWTDWTSNLLRYLDPDGNLVHACVRISEGCRFCYACALAGRWGRKGKDFTAENMKPLTPFFDIEGAREILRSRKITGQKMFVNDMTDLFGEWVPDEIIDQHFAIFALRPDVTFQVLTKRAKRMREYCQQELTDERVTKALRLFDSSLGEDAEAVVALMSDPLPNVHLGVSVEDQKNADERITHLVSTPAAIRWVSIEPLLSDLSLRWAKWEPWKSVGLNSQYDGLRRLDGIVIGGESGPGHREMPLDSAIALAENARDAGVKVFFKQDSGPRPGMQGRIPDDVWAMKDWPEAVTV